jgi:hypothetical protein
MLRQLSVLLAAAIALAGCSTGTIYKVGPDRPIKSVKAVVDQLKPGDIVQIDPGVYREIVKVKASGTAAAPILICGAPGKPRPLFDAAGIVVTGKGKVPRAVFQIEGDHVMLDHLELANAHDDPNPPGVRKVAAGVRINGGAKVVSDAFIHDCYIHHNDNGIVSNDTDTLVIDACEVAFNSTDQDQGYTHNFYPHANHLIIRNCYIHDSTYGQNVKCRAHFLELWHNWICDSNEGEVGPVDEHKSRHVNTTQPNSNALLVGNVIVSHARTKDGNPAKFIWFGYEFPENDPSGHNGTLYLFNNTLVAGTDKIVFIQLCDPKASLVASNNIFYGSDNILGLQKPAASIAGSNNLVPTNAKVPAEWTDTRKGDPGFVDAAKRVFLVSEDFGVKGRPPVRYEQDEKVSYVDGDGKTHTLVLPMGPYPIRGVRRVQTFTQERVVGAWGLLRPWPVIGGSPTTRPER